MIRGGRNRILITIIAILFILTQITTVQGKLLPLETSLTPLAPADSSLFLPILVKMPAANPFTFLAWGDTKKGVSTLAALSNQAIKLKPTFSIYTGDLEQSGFSVEGIQAWTRALNGNKNNGMFAITFPVRGNHDIYDPKGWQAYFDTAANARRVSAANFDVLNEDLTYAFDYGSAYFIGIDTAGSISRITDRQLGFLDKGLAGAEQRGLQHAFLFIHGPIYMIDGHNLCPQRVCPTPDSLVQLIKVLNKHAIVSAVFAAHEHLQAHIRLDSSRIPEITHPFEEFIVGSAGSELSPCNQAYRFDQCRSFHGFSMVSVSGRNFTVDVYQLGETAPAISYSFTKP